MQTEARRESDCSQSLSISNSESVVGSATEGLSVCCSLKEGKAQERVKEGVSGEEKGRGEKSVPFPRAVQCPECNRPLPVQGEPSRIECPVHGSYFIASDGSFYTTPVQE